MNFCCFTIPIRRNSLTQWALNLRWLCSFYLHWSTCKLTHLIIPAIFCPSFSEVFHKLRIESLALLVIYLIHPNKMKHELLKQKIHYFKKLFHPESNKNTIPSQAQRDKLYRIFRTFVGAIRKTPKLYPTNKYKHYK